MNRSRGVLLLSSSRGLGEKQACGEHPSYQRQHGYAYHERFGGSSQESQSPELHMHVAFLMSVHCGCVLTFVR